MRTLTTSYIMSRTTIDIDPTVMRQLKARQRRGGKTLGRLVSELLSAAMQADVDDPRSPAPLAWSARPMRALVDLDDPEAVRRAVEAP